MTPRWKAKRVEKLEKVKKYNYFRKVLAYFETEDGRKFRWARYGGNCISFNKDTKFYFLKVSNDYRHNEFRYWVYPISYDMATTTNPWDGRTYINYYGGKRDIVYEVK